MAESGDYLNPPRGGGKGGYAFKPTRANRNRKPAQEPDGMILNLPFPPSLGQYWRARGKKRFISAAGKLFRETVVATHLQRHPLTQRLRVSIDAYMPDRKIRDLDNIFKPLLDAMEHAGVYETDNQIDELTIRRCDVRPPGKLEVTIETIRL